MSRDGLAVRSLMSSAILASISFVRSDRLLATRPTLDWFCAKLVSICCKEAIADCASIATVVSGIGVGDGFGFSGEGETCSPGAAALLAIKARIRSKASRFTRYVTGL